mmetsp:Transcript_54445/g.151024  ORF Transcript_54445/g.151024 Transcript_54445/m.151024 type:complete len:250 (-) Transcript_54445:100-849(-)
MEQCSRDSDSFYVQDCRQVQNNTHAIQTLTGQISRLVGTMESDKDFEQCRGMVDEAVQQASETRAVLARIREHQHQATNPAERNNRRMMHQKLGDNLAITARVLEDVVRRFTAEERRRSAAPGAVDGGLGMAAADAAGGNDMQPLVSVSGSARSSSLPDRDVKRKQVDDKMQCLQRIYSDLADDAADGQQASFDALESHIDSLKSDIECGREDIELSKYGWDRRVRRRLWFWAAGALAAVGATALIFSS